ncbi:MAG: pantoate--beta-alanine ligase [Candidatus Omnitrophota bacterium]
MQVINSIKKMRGISCQLKCQNKTIGFVPTMGYLHKGHLSLVRKARSENDFVVLSIFVNPPQFGPTEDYNNYPRDFKRDKNLAEKEKVDCIFYPSTKNMYPEKYKTYVVVEELSGRLCGLYRQGHFKGVATIVSKLFNIVAPNTAYFGQKDAQQTVVIKQMAQDLNFPVKIKIVPTLREKDGLAMSSRNKYLSPVQREESVVLHDALKKAEQLVKKGITNAAKIKNLIKKMIEAKKTAKIEYVEIIDSQSLKPVKKIGAKTLIAVACYFGKARLIDNIIVAAPSVCGRQARKTKDCII